MTLRTLLFTDVVDSTRLVERLGDASAAQWWAEHDRSARALLARHRGREIDRTDGFFLLFDDPADAARFALDYHDALAGLALGARVGLHVGPVTLRENPPEDIARGAKPLEVEGLAKPLAARIMGLAEAGQTLISAAARDALAAALPDGLAIEAHGHYRLKGIQAPVEILQLGRCDGTTFAPPADADKAYRVVRTGELWRPVHEIRHNLPAERDAFFGRGAELQALAARLDGESRLVTLLGPGGTGKTRLALRHAWTWLGDWPGGVCFCDLSDARSLDAVLTAVAVALDVPTGKDDPVQQLGHAMASRGRCLVILDNFEQVVTEAAHAVGRWLDRAAEARFVVTSRERLHLAGETVLPVEPLPLASDAIDLFVARARAQRPGFVLGPDNRPQVAEVVAMLDGLPLAIELAAARVRVLSPAQLVERLRHRFTLLAGARGVAARQATLRAAIDWSWDLLSPWEQAAFAKCAVFQGGFTLEAAEAVLDLAAWPDAPPAMDAVQALVDKSLLHTWAPAGPSRYAIDEPYFGMYLSLQEYAQEKLVAAAPPAQAACETRHGRHFAQYGTEVALGALHTHDGVRRWHALALERGNLVAACRRAVGRGDAEVAVASFRATWEVLALQGPLTLATELGTQVLALDGIDPALRAAAGIALAQALRRSGRHDDARPWLLQALAHVEAHADRRGQSVVLNALGHLHREQGRMAEAQAAFDAALGFARACGDPRLEGAGLAGLGQLHREQSRNDEARATLEAALAIAQLTGDRREEGIVLGTLGLLNSEQGRGETAHPQLAAALAIAREVGDRGLEGAVLANLGQLHSEQGRMDAAQRHLAEALALQRTLGQRRLEGIALGNLGAVCSAQGQMPAALDHYTAALAIARELGNRRHQGFLHLSLGILHQAQGRTDVALAELTRALDIAREVGDRRVEGIALSRRADGSAGLGQFDAARADFDQALALARAVGYRRLEGVVLGGMGHLLARQGRMAEALHMLHAGADLLRAVDDREELAKLLCVLGRTEAAGGAEGAARAALAEAEALAAAWGAAPDSEVARDIDALRAALA